MQCTWEARHSVLRQEVYLSPRLRRQCEGASAEEKTHTHFKLRYAAAVV